jgi:transcriptional regulator GlxA family with amidase domain
MSVPTSLLHQVDRNILDTWEKRGRCQTTLIEPGAAIVQRVRSLMRATIHQAVPGRWQVERASRLATDLATIIDQVHKTPNKTCRTSRRIAWSTISRAREYIEAHLAEPISISNVSEYSATSLSKLERTFRRELQMSPSQYILARRLAAVNRELNQHSSSGRKVAQIAMDHGFHHLGRFAGAYRAHFGELPSETIGLR